MTARDRPRVDIVLLHWKNYPDTRACLESLRAVTYPNVRIVVVDNASRDGSAERLQAEYPECTYVLNEANLGFARGCNRGIAAAMRDGADYVLLLNNDIVAGPGFLDPAVEAAEADPQVGLVTGKVLLPGEPPRIWHAGGHIDMLRVMGVSRGFREEDRGQYDTPCDTRWASGAMMLIRRSVLETVGLLPEEYFFGQEEWDYSTAVIRAGLRIRYVPEFTAVHDCGGSYTHSHPILIGYNGARNKLIFAQKYLPRALWLPWLALYWLYVHLWWPRRARAVSRSAADYRAQKLAPRLAIRDHVRGASVQHEDLVNAARVIGPMTSWQTTWASQA